MEGGTSSDLQFPPLVAGCPGSGECRRKGRQEGYTESGVARSTIAALAGYVSLTRSPGKSLREGRGSLDGLGLHYKAMLSPRKAAGLELGNKRSRDPRK